jgi:hypothetical protein
MARLATVLVFSLMLGLAGDTPTAAPVPDGGPLSGTVVHHYTIDGAIRPLLFFWISRSNIGGATITWRRGPGETEYSLLIGTDPSRAPRNLNRWGYVDEQLRGRDATIVGLMTRSDEQSLEEAKASTKNANGEPQAFRVIRESVNGDLARAAITTLGTPQHYTFRQLDEVLAHVPPTSAFDHERSTTLPPGAAPGFLTALDRVMDETLAASGTDGGTAPVSIQFVYYGKLYRLRATEAKHENELTLDGRDYQHLLDAKFEMHNIETGDDTDFEMTYGTEGTLRGVPIVIEYQPRWWLRVTLRLADGSAS